MNEFDKQTMIQNIHNIEKHGKQLIEILLIACIEEFGEIGKAFLEKSNFKEEIIHLSALLKNMYETYEG